MGYLVSKKQRKLILDYYTRIHEDMRLSQALTTYTLRKIETGIYSFRDFLHLALSGQVADGDLTKRLREQLD